MAYELNWSMLGQPVDVGGAVQAGYEHGLALRRQQTEAAFQDQERQRQTETRSALSDYMLAGRQPQVSALPATGPVTPPVATAGAPTTPNVAAVPSAFSAQDQALTRLTKLDPEVAVQAQQQGAHEQEQHLAQMRETLGLMDRLLSGVTDEASYQHARASAAHLGLDLAQVPANFDPEWVQQSHREARALQGATDHDLMAVAQGSAVIDRTTGAVVYRNPNQPRYYSVPQGGRLELDPSYQGPTQDGAPPRVLTDDDIRRMEHGGGAGQPQAHGTFPR